MKFKHKMYKRIADYFYAKVPVEQPQVPEEQEDPNEPPCDLLVALNEKIMTTPINNICWSSDDKKDGFYIKHIDRAFSIQKIGDEWEVKVRLGNNVMFTSGIYKSVANLKYIRHIFDNMHDKALKGVVEFLKTGAKSESSESE